MADLHDDGGEDAGEHAADSLEVHVLPVLDGAEELAKVSRGLLTQLGEDGLRDSHTAGTSSPLGRPLCFRHIILNSGATEDDLIL